MMTDAEDQIASDHPRALRGMSTSAMRLIEIVQRRQEDARRREAEGRRGAAQPLRARQGAERTAPRTIAAQGLDPRWREAAGDREIATACVYAEAYAETDPLARVAHEQLSQMLEERHEDVAAFIDSNMTQQDLDRVPAPEGEPSPTQQRWIDAADRKSTRLNSSHVAISYAVFCLKKKVDGGVVVGEQKNDDVA